MIRCLTIAEIAMLYQAKPATIRWYAHRDQWRRSNDHRKPMLYRAEDVEATMKARRAIRNSDNLTP